MQKQPTHPALAFQKYEIKLILPDGKREVGILYTNRDHLLELEYGGKLLVADTDTGNGCKDFFEALSIIRRQLDGHGILVECYGASINVWASGLRRQMGNGLRAYKLVQGQKATQADLVFIFDSGDDVKPATVDEQRKFMEEWWQSLRLPPLNYQT